MSESSGRLLRFRDVCARVGLSRSEIYRLLSLNKFPRPCPLGTRLKAFVEAEVDQWVADKIAGRK